MDVLERRGKRRKMKFWDKFVKDSTELFILLGLIELTDDEKKELEEK